MIRSLCQFDYLPVTSIQPEVMDTGRELLLANFAADWTIECDNNQMTPTRPIEYQYIVIPKSFLCQCSISTGKYVLHANIDSCTDLTEKSNPLHFIYTINQAVQIYLDKNLPEYYLMHDIKLSHPLRSVHVNLTLDHPNRDVPYSGKLSLPDALERARKHQKIFQTEMARNRDSIQKLKSWNWGLMNWIAGIALGLLSLSFVILTVLIACYARNRSTVQKLIKIINPDNHLSTELQSVPLILKEGHTEGEANTSFAKD